MLSYLASLWNVALFLGVIVTLCIFLHRVFLKKIFRLRRIERARDRRLMREASRRD